MEVSTYEAPREILQADPNPRQRSADLDHLVGTWTIRGRAVDSTGELNGRVRFEWLDGGYFLIRHVDLTCGGRRMTGIEIIANRRNWNGAASENSTSRFFDDAGNVSHFVWEFGDDTVTIWGGHIDAPADFTGRFSDDRNVLTGRWSGPGGAYDAVATRLQPCKKLISRTALPQAGVNTTAPHEWPQARRGLIREQVALGGT